jgi:hypothetical protein
MVLNQRQRLTAASDWEPYLAKHMICHGPHSTIVLAHLSGAFGAATLAADLGLGTLAAGPE